MRDPVPHQTEPHRDEAVVAFSTMPLRRHETGIKQDAEVLGNGWAAHLKLSRNRVDGAVGVEQEIQNPATRGMANCPKDIRLAIGSHHHVANIRKQTLTRQVRSGPCRLGRAGRTWSPKPRIPDMKSSIAVLSPRLSFSWSPSSPYFHGFWVPRRGMATDTVFSVIVFSHHLRNALLWTDGTFTLYPARFAP